MINEAAEFDTTSDSLFKNVLICDTQPVAVEGMKWLIKNSGDLQFAGAVTTLDAVYELLNPEGAKAAAAEKAKLAAEKLVVLEITAACMEQETVASIEPATLESQETEISAEPSIAAV